MWLDDGGTQLSGDNHSYKDEAVGQEEVQQRADGNGSEIRHVSRQPRFVYEEEHQREVCGQAQDAVCEVEAHQHLNDSGSRAVSPGPLPVPYEIVQHARFDG